MSPVNCPNSESSNYYKMTKVEVVASFREMLKDSPTGTLLKGDRIAKREAFNNYVDMLNKDGLVTDYQAYNWSNPF